MASFAQLMAQLEGEQSLESTLDRSTLGMNVEQESQDLEAARSDYYDKVEEAERDIARKQRKRGMKGLLGTAIGIGSSFIPGLGPLGGALIGGLTSALGRRSVSPYSGTISSSLPGGDFHSGARKDFSKDIASTNQFFQDAREGQGLLDWTSGLGDAMNIYGASSSLADLNIGGGKLRTGAQNKIMDLKGKESGFGKNLFKGRVGKNVKNRVLQGLDSSTGGSNIDWRGGNPLELLFDIQKGTLAQGFDLPKRGQGPDMKLLRRLIDSDSGIERTL